jgi:hypothetical protein
VEALDLAGPGARAAISDAAAEDLRARADAAAAALRITAAALKQQAEVEDADPATLRELLLRLAGLGIPGAVPASGGVSPAERRAALTAQAKVVMGEVEARTAQLKAVEDGFARGDRSAEREHDLGRLRVVFGDEFRALPRCTAADPAQLSAAFAASNELQGNHPFAATTWFHRVARVQAGAARLHSALLYAEVSGGGRLAFTVGQLPYQVGDRWVALKPTGERIPGGRISLVAHTPLVGGSAPIDAAGDLAGLMIDEWVEVVPSRAETTAVAFHYDAPAAEAPQAVLLAVAPDLTQPWGLRTISQIVRETLELAKLRLVDLEALGEFGQALPALLFANNLAHDTIATDFGAAAGPDQDKP